MSPLWRSRLHAGNLALFFTIGIFSVSLFAPLGRWLHAVGHGLFAVATSCGWIGIHVPLFDHGLALLNYPTIIYGSTFVSLWYWNGGFLILLAPLAALFAFPFPPGFIPQLLPRLACLHLLMTAGILPVVESIQHGDIYMMADILRLPAVGVAAFWILIFSGLFMTFFFLLLRLPSGSLTMKAFQRLLFTWVIWTLPTLLFCTAGFFLEGWRGLPLFVALALSLLPLLMAPFISASYTIFPRPGWGKTVLSLSLAVILFNVVHLWVTRDLGPDARALLWSHPSTNHNIPTSVLLWRLYP